MKLAVSSTSFAAAFTLLAPKYSNAVMASAVDAAYENKIEQAADKHPELRSLVHYQECSFASSGLRLNEADIGILGCAEDFVCVEDSRSSLGGRCVIADMKHRDLQGTAACDTKCTGTDACAGLSKDFIDNNIGEKSCCGEDACKGLDG